jgi:hypothetical protein
MPNAKAIEQSLMKDIMWAQSHRGNQTIHLVEYQNGVGSRDKTMCGRKVKTQWDGWGWYTTWKKPNFARTCTTCERVLRKRINEMMLSVALDPDTATNLHTTLGS